MIASGNSTQLIFNKECYPNYHVSLSNMEEEWFVFKVPLFLSGVHLVSFPTHTEQPHHLDPAPHNNNDDRFLINGGYCSSLSQILIDCTLYSTRHPSQSHLRVSFIHPLPKETVSHTRLGFFIHSSST